MNCCAYKEQAGCNECKHVSYRDCEKFRLWRTKWLLLEILPVNIRKSKPMICKCYFSRSEDAIKQRVVATALEYNSKVSKFTLSQAVSMALENDLPESMIIYIEIKKVVGESSKIQMVLESFVEKLLLNGKYVAIYAPVGTISINEDWVKVKEDDKHSI